MKKLIGLFMLLVLYCTNVLAVDTLKTAGKITYWSEGVRGDSKIRGQLGYIYGTTTKSDTLTGTAAILVSQPIGVTGTSTVNAANKPRNSFSNTKFMVGLNIATAYTGGSAYLVVQGSGDGVNWTSVYTCSTNTSPATTGTTWYLADLSNIYLPYYRLAFNTNAATVNRVGKLYFLYAVPNTTP